jgi:DNA-binding LacI/PurR family transcriptional regulator
MPITVRPPVRLDLRVTSIDVARRAGVSQSAVSLVLGDKAAGRVGKHTQEQILKAARELGYQPNRAARMLRLGCSRLLVLAVPDVSNPYFAAVLQGAEQMARKHGYSVMLTSVCDEHDWQHVIVDAISSRSVDGFLLFTMSPPSAKAQRALRGRAIMVDASSRELPSLRLGIEAGMRAAMNHLLNLGHTRIAHLAAAVDAETFHLRNKAYLDTLREAALPVASCHQARASFTVADAFQRARAILGCAEPPSAIVCDSDVLAVGVYKAAKELGRSIPRDLSVVGFDDSVFAGIVDPELTTVAIPKGMIGERGVLLLLSTLEGSRVPMQTTVPLELVVRGSTTRLSTTEQGWKQRKAQEEEAKR